MADGKVRIGIVGAGCWAADNHIPILKGFDDVEVAAACRLGREELRRLQEQFQIPFVTEDYKELLDLPGLDGVVVSSPHNLHFEHSLAALKKGLHVVCEKPITLTASEARQLQAESDSRKLHFLIPYGWNYTEVVDHARQAILGGEVGEVQYVHCYMASALRDLFGGQGAWFAEQSFFKPEMATWSDPALGGGFAHGQLTHALGLLFWITELEPVEVFALVGNSITGADLYNSISCRFANGATGSLGGAATMPPGSTHQVDVRVFGSEGMLLLDIERPRMEIRRNDGRNTSLDTTMEPGFYPCAEPLRTFIDLIEGKDVVNKSPAFTGVRAVEVIDAAFRSVRSRAVERIQ